MKKIISVLLCIILAASALFALSSCSCDHKDGKWKSDASKHWYECDNCGEKYDEAEHDIENGVCKTCGYTAAPAEHKHEYASSFEYDDSSHFKTCTVQGCNEQKNKGEHVILLPEKTQNGNKTVRTYKCRVCTYARIETAAEDYKVMSSNVLGNYTADEDSETEKRMKTLTDCFKKYLPDSIGLQEYGDRNQIFLEQNLPEGYALVEFEQDWVATVYNSDKFKVEKTVCKMLTSVSKQKYCFTITVFSHKDSGALAYVHGNLHLEYESRETRVKNAIEVNAALRALYSENKSYEALPLVITGDYNSSPKSEANVFKTLAGNMNIQDAPEVAIAGEGEQTSYHQVGDTASRGDAIDHVLVNADTTLVFSHDIIKEDACPDIPSASDHYPVLVEFAPKKAQ